MTSKDEEDSEEEGYPIVITRSQWGARPPKSAKALEGYVTDIFYTDTDTIECHSQDECIHLIRKIQNYQIDAQGLTDIQPNFLIGGDNNVYEGRGWKTAGPESSKRNVNGQLLTGKSIEIAFIGKFKDKEPPDKMMTKSNGLIKFGMDTYKIYLRESTKEDEENDQDEEEKEEMILDEKDLNQVIEVPPGTFDSLPTE